MKTVKCISVICSLALLTACGNTSQIDGIIEEQQALQQETDIQTVQPQSTELPEISIRTDPPETDSGISSMYNTDGYDIDLTKLDSNMIFAQVYDMIYNPDSYMGKKILVKGYFSYYQDTDSMKEYFAAYVPDAAGCCGQGIEFVLAGEHSYPQDYPELGTEIYVTGNFNSYQENGATYCQLLNAEFVENA